MFFAGGRATPGPASGTLTDELTPRPFLAGARCPPGSGSLPFPALIARDSAPSRFLSSAELELLDLRNGVFLSGRSGRK